MTDSGHWLQTQCCITRQWLPAPKGSGPSHLLPQLPPSDRALLLHVTSRTAAINVLCDGLHLLKHHKAKLTAVIMSHVSYYSLCFCFSWNVPCRLTWQSKCNNTFKFQALSFQCWCGKNHNSTRFSLALSSSFTHAHVLKKHTFAREIGDDTNTLHTTVYKTDD